MKWWKRLRSWRPLWMTAEWRRQREGLIAEVKECREAAQRGQELRDSANERWLTAASSRDRLLQQNTEQAALWAARVVDRDAIIAAFEKRLARRRR